VARNLFLEANKWTFQVQGLELAYKMQYSLPLYVLYGDNLLHQMLRVIRGVFLGPILGLKILSLT
jgi:hypothetical protein